MSERTDADIAQEILERRDAQGQRIYDQPGRDPRTGEMRARRMDDHAVEDTVAG